MRHPEDSLIFLTTRQLLLAVVAMVLMLGLACSVSYELGKTSSPRDIASRRTDAQAGPAMFQPPPETSIPPGPNGAAIRRGEEIFRDTGTYAARYVGNGLACANCHLDNGRRAYAIPLWAAWGAYPAYRAKNDQINTMEDRIRDCFTYSMNAPKSPSGGPPPRANQIYSDLQIFFAWLATGAPIGTDLPGRGYPKLTPSAQGADPHRGAQVFARICAACHGVDGAGQKSANGKYVFPPLWGPMSYNRGAGMAEIKKAAGFIKANMPFGNGYSLTDQQAWDVAAYIDSQDRPRDPRATTKLTGLH